jgi:hypothetical protein
VQTGKARILGPLAIGVLVAGSFLPELLRVLLESRALLVQSVPDDAFYYLEIGQRAARGQGATFDGVHATNGFHPLWQLVVTGLAELTHGDALIRAALVVGLVMALAGTVLLAVIVRRGLGTGPALLAVLVAVHAPGFIADGASGMESGLVTLCVGLLVVAFCRADRTRRPWDAALLGGACGLLVMARLDFATVVWVVPLALAWRAGWLRGAVCVAAGVALCVPYALWNAVTFGHLLPVSATVKQHAVSAWITTNFGGRLTFAYVHFTAELIGEYLGTLWRNAASTGGGNVTAILLVVACACGVVVLYRRRVAVASGPLLALAVALAMLAGKAVVDVVFSPLWVTAWYAAAQRTAIAMLVGALLWFAVQPLRERSGAFSWVPVAALALAFLPVHLGVAGVDSVAVDGHDWEGADLQAALWIAGQGPPGRYGSPDAGVLGYFTDESHATVTDLDGLVSTYAYAALYDGGASSLQRYRGAGIDRLVARRPLNSPDVPACAQVIWTSPEAVVYGGGLDQPEPTSIPVRIWDLRSC